MDHYFQMEMLGPENGMLEGYTTLGFLAARTRALKLGLLVMGVTYRPPGLLAKIVTTLDVLSGGRAELGIGAAWYEREHRGLGVDFPPLAERFERLEETLQICLQMWSDDNGPFEGTHYKLRGNLERAPEPAASPPADSYRRWRRTEDAAPGRQVRQRPATSSPATAPTACAISSRYCAATATPRAATTTGCAKTILYTNPAPGGDEAGAFAKEMEAYAKLGVEAVMLMPFGDHPVEVAANLGPVVARLGEL